MQRSEFLDMARAIVCNDREHDYGSPEDNFSAIGRIWTDFLVIKNGAISNACGKSVQISAEDVAEMMALLKVVRIITGRYKADSFVDAIGYMTCAGEIASKDEAVFEISENSRR